MASVVRFRRRWNWRAGRTPTDARTSQEGDISPGTAKDPHLNGKKQPKSWLKVLGPGIVSGASDNAQEKRAFHSYHSPNHPAGPIIVFDVAKAPPVSGRNGFYISSSNPNAIVLLMNASSLPADLAIVSPLPIAVEGGFNDQGVRRAGSLVSSNGVMAVPVGW